MGYRKRGPKPKHLLTQLPSFALRSNVLSGLQKASQDNVVSMKPTTDAKQMHQFELNSRKQHQYQQVCRESPDDVLSTSKRKHFYQLNSKKHHHYQPDPKQYQSMKEALTPECLDLQQKQIEDTDLGCLRNVKDNSKEDKKLMGESGYQSEFAEDGLKSVNETSSKLKIVKNKNKNGRIVIVMSKYMENGKQVQNGEDKVLGSETNSTNGTMDTTKHLDRNGFNNTEPPNSGFMHGLIHPDSATSVQTNRAEDSQNLKLPDGEPVQLTIPKDLTKGSQKRRHSDPVSDPGQAKRFLNCRSISAPHTNTSHHASKSMHVSGHQNSTLDFLNGCQDEPIDLSCARVRDTRNSSADTQINGNPKPNEKKAVPSQQVSEPSASFSPFLGNIIITDITANCLTVTFKEYVTV
ncbi:E3 SUMO-protein ligase CBX4-like isoform X2 [Trichomycterus rosablanca]